MKMKRSINDAYSLILEDIMNGSLKPGSVVTETYLAEKYKTSRTPVREAINILECEGLVVTSNRTKKIYSLTAEDIREIFELKEIVEGNVAWNAALNITDIQSEELKKIMAEMSKLRELAPKDEAEAKAYLEKWLTTDSDFHGLLFRAAGNKRARQIIARLNIQWHRLKVGLAAMEGRIGYAIPEHEAVGRYILEKNPEKAREEMVDHMENLKKYIIKLMGIFG